MKRVKNYIYLLGCIGLCTWGCSESEMIKYQEAPAVNFTAMDAAGEVNDEVSLLSVTYDFTSSLGATITSKDVLLKLQGFAVEKDLKVTVKIVPVEGYPTPDIEIVKNGLIPAGKLVDTLTLLIHKPEQKDTAYMVNLVVDYEQSDVNAGTAERQTFEITVRDDFEFTWEKMKITAEDWEDYLQPLIGDPSAVKVHFILAYYNVSDLETPMIYMYYYPEEVDLLKEALEEYNQKHGPLKDENGNLVSFEPIS